MDTQDDVTELLARLSDGDHDAEQALLPLIYRELHRLARAQLRSERRDHTLQATALVNEAWMRMSASTGVEWQNRIHFFRVSARIMRRILIDYARQRNAEKRGSGISPVSLNEALLISDNSLSLVLEVDEVLQELEARSPRLAEIVEMQFFAGLTDAEIASALGISERTVSRDWIKARAWLHGRLNPA